MYELRLVKKQISESVLTESKEQHSFFEPTEFFLDVYKNENFHPSDIMCLAISKNLLAIGYQDGLIKLFDLEKQVLINTLAYHKLCVYALDIYNDELFSVSSDKTIRCYNLTNNKLMYGILAHNNHIYNIKNTEDTFFTSSIDKTIKAWDKKTKKILFQINTGEKSAWNLLIKNQKLYSAFSDGSIKVWDILKGSFLFECKNHEQSITSFIEYNNTIISASKDGVINIHKADNLELINSFKAHNSTIWSMCVSGDKLISCSEDRFLKTWNLLDFTLEKAINLKNDLLAVSNTYNKIIVAGANGNLFFVKKLPKYNSHNINFEVDKVEKSPFETPIEYEHKKELAYKDFIKRVIAYDYIEIGKVELLAEQYDIEKQLLPIKAKINSHIIEIFSKTPKHFTSLLNINPHEAKKLTKEIFKNLYIKYFIDSEFNLNYKLFIEDNILYELKIELNNEVLDKNKHDLKKDRLKINQNEIKESNTEYLTKPFNNCNSIDISDTFRNPFENTEDFFRRVSNKLLNYKEIQIGKVTLISSKYDLEKKHFPVILAINCEKILNLINGKLSHNSFFIVDRTIAKKIYEHSSTHNLYINFVVKEGKLFFEFSLIFESKKYYFH